jgi:NADP-dependent 3-hydroxy acid dehydrogenase YdfG
MDISNAVAVVTGASRGIGRTISEELIAAGAKVYGLARTTDKLDALHETHGEAFQQVPCDVRDRNRVDEAIGTIAGDAGGIDMLINNAGLGRFGPVDQLPPDEWDLQIDTNLTGVYNCTRAVVPIMKQQNSAAHFGGHIVNIVSIAGLIGNADLSSYNASKFGVTGFSEALMKELRDDGIKVTAIYPGSTESNFADEAGHSGASNPMTAEDVAQTVLHVLNTPKNYLISDVVMRPLQP